IDKDWMIEPNMVTTGDQQLKIICVNPLHPLNPRFPCLAANESPRHHEPRTDFKIPADNQNTFLVNNLNASAYFKNVWYI
ncbi:MAG: hypothetical protein L6Q59_14335, partial [Ignavibacteriaceae bacterium]|nr:hypothetical protein [Ignavibacteriaceae bacterium]